MTDPMVLGRFRPEVDAEEEIRKAREKLNDEMAEKEATFVGDSSV